MKLFGMPSAKGVAILSGLTWTISLNDGVMMTIDVCLDIYDSIQRDASIEGTILGAGLTIVKDVGLLYLDKDIMYECTALGSCFGPIGTAVGFVIGTGICLFVDWFVGGKIDDLIDSITK